MHLHLLQHFLISAQDSKLLDYLHGRTCTELYVEFLYRGQIDGFYPRTLMYCHILGAWKVNDHPGEPRDGPQEYLLELALFRRLQEEEWRIKHSSWQVGASAGGKQECVDHL